MSTIDTTYSDLGLAIQQTSAEDAKQSLGQDDFLRLMTTQLQNQDPFKPMENGEFLGQMAQFSTVSGLQELQDSFASLASSLVSDQTLQAAGLIGHSVMVESEVGYLPEGIQGENGEDGEAGVMQGAVYLPSSGRVVVDIVDASGATVQTIDLGTQPAGAARFEWDGVGDDGERLAAGSYALQARLLQDDAEAESLPTFAVGQVQSVALGSSGLMLQLQGLPSTALADVYQIL